MRESVGLAWFQSSISRSQKVEVVDRIKRNRLRWWNTNEEVVCTQPIKYRSCLRAVLSGYWYMISADFSDSYNYSVRFVSGNDDKVVGCWCPIRVGRKTKKLEQNMCTFSLNWDCLGFTGLHKSTMATNRRTIMHLMGWCKKPISGDHLHW